MPSILPVPTRIRPLASFARRAARQASAPHWRGMLLARLAREAGLAPLGVAAPPARGGSAPPSAPGAVVVCEPGPPERRAALLARLGRFRGRGPVLALTPAEWQVWAAGPAGARIAWLPPAWGALPEPSPCSDPRRRDLRGVAGVHAGPLASALHARDGLACRALLAWERDELETLGNPSLFPPRPQADAGLAEHEAAAIGAMHAVFGAEVAIDPGFAGQPPPTDTPRSEPAVRRLAEPLLADLPPWFEEEVQALHLLPGPWGTRVSWQILALVDDEAPLLRAARLRDRLRQHLGMLPAAERLCLTLGGGPLVLTRAAAAGIVRRRLFGRPLRRLALRAARQVLLGSDILASALEGPDLVPDDFSFELAAMAESTAACWQADASAAIVSDLLFCAWPAVLHLLRGGPPGTSLAEIHESLARSADPAIARIAATARRLPLRDPLCADPGRPVALLRDHGPALVRIQEAAFEALAAARVHAVPPRPAAGEI